MSTFTQLCKTSMRAVTDFKNYGICNCIKRCYLNESDLQKYLAKDSKITKVYNDPPRTDNRLSGVRSGEKAQ